MIVSRCTDASYGWFRGLAVLRGARRNRAKSSQGSAHAEFVTRGMQTAYRECAEPWESDIGHETDMVWRSELCAAKNRSEPATTKEGLSVKRRGELARTAKPLDRTS